ncbi:MAG: response regulator [Cyclobacteriaceae bacterium]
MLAKATQSGTWVWDLLNDHFEIDEQLKSLLGYSEDFPSNTNLWEAFASSEEYNKVLQKINVLSHSNECNAEILVRLNHKNGELLDCKVKLLLNRDSSGKSFEIFGTLSLASREKVLEQEAQRAWKTLEILSRSMSELFIEVDHDQVIKHWNRSCQKFLGKAQSDVLNKPIKDVLFDKDFQSDLFAALVRSEPTETELQFEKDKECLVFEIRIQPVESGAFILGSFKSKVSNVTTQPLEGVNILYADDLKSNLLMMKGRCSNWGADVDFAFGGQEAILKAQSGSYDLIIMDLQMPDMSGFETANTLINSGESTPILAYTSAFSDEIGTKVRQAGMVDVIAKPTSNQELLDKLIRYSSKEATKEPGIESRSVDLELMESTDQSTYTEFINSMLTELAHAEIEINTAIESNNFELFRIQLNNIKPSLHVLELSNFQELLKGIEDQLKFEVPINENVLSVTKRYFGDTKKLLTEKLHLTR